MRLKSLNLALLLLLCPVCFAGQSTGVAVIKTDGDLLRALLAVETGDETVSSTLLEDNRQFVTKRLCDSLLQAATNSSAFGQSPRSLFILDIANQAATALGDKKILAVVLYKTGRLHFEQGKIKSAIDDYIQAKERFEEVGSHKDLVYLLAELGAAHIYVADYTKAEDYSEQSLALAGSLKDSNEPPGAMLDEYGPAFAWSNLGHVATWKGDFDLALNDFQKSLAMWKDLKQRGYWSAGNVTDALVDIAHVYQAIGDHTKVLSYLSQAMEIARTLLDRGRLAAVLNDMGVLYIEQGDYAKASAFVDQSLKIFTQVNNKREIARNILNNGVIDYRQRRYDAASAEFRESLRKAEEIGAAEIAIADKEGLGSVYQAQRDYSAASEWFEEAWAQAQIIGDKMRMTELLWRKGQVFYSEGDYLKSSATADSAANLAFQLRSPLMTYLTLTLRGEAYHAQHADERAAQSFTKAIEAVEHMRDEVAGAEKEQELFFENKTSPYHQMVTMLVEQKKPVEALTYAERAKGRVLLEVLRNGRVNINKSSSQAERSDEQRLYREIVSLNTQIRAERMNPESNDARVGELETRLEKARRAYETFQASLYAAHPELKTKRGVFSAFTSEDAASVIPDSRTAVLEYVVTGDQVFVFALTKDSTNLAKVRVEVRSIKIMKSDLADIVDKYRSLLATNHPGFHQAGCELYDLLVKPIEPYLRDKTTICIIPDGPLWNLPFQALQSADDKYLLESHAVYYAPSIQVLRQMRKRSETLQSTPSTTNGKEGAAESSGSLKMDLYGVANTTIGSVALVRALTRRNAPFVPLPETETEVRAIADDVYGPRSSTLRIGAAAREETVKAEIGKYRVVHFATHGVLDDENPLYSYIVLAPGNDSHEDGLLEAWELMEMDLRAELVVLSACDTARGRVGDGEGMIGMSWALFVAGVPTTVASQWQVPSESTTNLMVAFHKNIASGGSGGRTSIGEAWRQAALRMIADPRYRMKPYYWAGFVVIGDGGR